MKEGWTYKKLGEIGQIITGNTPSTRDIRNYSSEDRCFVKPSDLGKEGITIISNSEFHISEYAFNNSRQLPIGSILTTCIGTIGKIGVLDVQATCNQQINALIPKNGINSVFVAYNLLSQRHLLEKIANAPIVPIINKGLFSEIKIAIPSISLQQQIVSELNLLSDVIEKKKAQIEEFDKLAQSTFYEMFGDPVTNEKSWEIKQLGDVSDITSSKRIFANEYREDGIPFYRGKEITEKSKGQEISLELFISEERYEEIKESFGVPSIGDILITAVGTIGNIWVVNDTNPFYFKDGNIIWVKEFKNIDPTYFKSVLTILIATYKSEMANGCAYNALTIVNLKKMSFALPPLALQQEFAAKIEAIEQMKAKVRQSLKESEELFNSRMDYYFN